MESDLLAAFPRDLGSAVRQASEGLGTPSHRTSVRLVQDSYQRRWGDVRVAGEELRIPYRHYQPPTRRVANAQAESVRQAWLTRSHDGHVRQGALRALLTSPAHWHVPFVVQLCGEYLVDVGRDIADFAEEGLASNQQAATAYTEFWRDNPEFVALTFARAASYWDSYYRGEFSLRDYPPRVALAAFSRLATNAE